MLNNNASKVLLVDTAFAALPIYNYLVRAGFNVWVMGNRSDDVLAQKAGPNWIEQDYSKVSEVEVHLERLGIDYMVPGCTDVSIDTCVTLRGGASSLDTLHSNSVLSNKSSFRELCSKLDIPSPKVVTIDDFPGAGLYICKPVDSFSGRGVTVFDGRHHEKAVAAYETAVRESVSSTSIIESYVEGQLFSFSAFVENHKVTASFLVKEGSSANPFAVDTSYVVDTMPEKSMKLLQSSIESISKHLQLTDGLIHTQFIYDGDIPILIEMSRRCPGDLYSLLIEYSTGFSYAAKYASFFVGESYDSQKVAQSHVLRHTVTSDENVIFGKFEFVSQQPVRAYYPLQTVGRPLLHKQKSRVAILFTEYKSSSVLLENYDIFMERKAYFVE